MPERRLPPDLARRAAVWDACGGICHYCGKAMHPFRDFQIEHVLPRSAGGGDDLSNLVGACWPCNVAKRSTTDREARKRARPIINGQTIRRLRQERGWTQYQLAETSGHTQSLIWKIERDGGEIARVWTVLNLARVFAVEPASILRSGAGCLPDPK